MRRRIWIIIAVLGIGATMIGVFFLGGIFRRAAAAAPAPTAIPPRTEAVLITTHDIPIRSVLKPQDLILVEVPVELAPPNALTTIDEAMGRITKIQLISGELILNHHLADPSNRNQDLAFVIGEDQVLMAFPASDLMSQINILQPGDVVDILVSIEQPVLPGQVGVVSLTAEEEETEEELFTFSAMQKVEISAVVVEIEPRRTGTTARTSQTNLVEGDTAPQPTPTPDPSEIEPQAILLALSPQDALVLKHLKDAGGVIDIVLRAPTAARIFELNPVMSEYLKDRYQLVISR